MTTVASAPGKLVLLGEYAVLEGAPALVTAVNRRATVTCGESKTFTLTAPCFGITGAGLVIGSDDSFRVMEKTHQSQLALACTVLSFAQRWARQRGGVLAPCHLHLETAEFFHEPNGAKLGLGSSAALTCALLAAVLAHSALMQPFMPLDAAHCRHAFMQMAFAAHQAAQNGLGSGIDVAASVWGGQLRFVRHRDSDVLQATPLSPLAGLTLLPVWAGHATSTPTMLAQVLRLKENQPQQYWAVLEKLAILANAGVEFWALANLPALLTVVPGFLAALGELGDASGAPIVTERHTTIGQHAARVGGVYKCSGAGGGDMGVVFCASEATARRVGSTLRAAGFAVPSIQCHAPGLQVTLEGEQKHG